VHWRRIVAPFFALFLSSPFLFFTLGQNQDRLCWNCNGQCLRRRFVLACLLQDKEGTVASGLSGEQPLHLEFLAKTLHYRRAELKKGK
jgi:hypothetical protein